MVGQPGIEPGTCGLRVPSAQVTQVRRGLSGFTRTAFFGGFGTSASTEIRVRWYQNWYQFSVSSLPIIISQASRISFVPGPD